MPTLPPKICSHPGCNALAVNGGYRCARHPAKPFERQRAQPDKRPSAWRRGYNTKWQRVRSVYIRQHPYCEQCEAPADEIHHIKPLSEGGTNDFSNLKALCKTCHSKITLQSMKGKKQ